MGKETTSPTPTTLIARPHEEENLHGEGTAGGSGGGGCWCGWFRTRTNMFCELNTSGRKPDLADLATRDPSAGLWVGAFIRKKKPDTTTRKSKSNFICDGGGWMRSEKQRTSFLLVVQDEVIKQPRTITQPAIVNPRRIHQEEDPHNLTNPPIETVHTAAIVSRRSVSHNNPTTLRRGGSSSSTGTTKNKTSRNNRTNTNNCNHNSVTRHTYDNVEETSGTYTGINTGTGPTARRTNNLNNHRTVLHNRSNTHRSTTVVQSRMMTPKSNIRSPGTGGTSTSKSRVPIQNNNNNKRWY